MGWTYQSGASCSDVSSWVNTLWAPPQGGVYIGGNPATLAIAGGQTPPPPQFTLEQIDAALKGFSAFYSGVSCGPIYAAGDIPGNGVGQFNVNPFERDSNAGGLAPLPSALRAYVILGILTYLQNLDVASRMEAMGVIFSTGYAFDELGGLQIVISGEIMVAVGASGAEATAAWGNVASWLDVAALVQITPTIDLLNLVTQLAAGTTSPAPPSNVQAAAIRVLAGQVSTDPTMNRLLQDVLAEVSTSTDASVSSAAALLRGNIFSALAATAAAGGGSPGTPPAPATTAPNYWPYVWIVGGALAIGGVLFGGAYWLRSRRFAT